MAGSWNSVTRIVTMKKEIDSRESFDAWLIDPCPAVFQDLDLRSLPLPKSVERLRSCAFLGCEMTTAQLEATTRAACLILPPVADLPFDPFRSSLYTPGDLFAEFDPRRPEESYRECLDWRVYQSCIDPVSRRRRPVSADELLLRRLHDASMSDALDDLLEKPAPPWFLRTNQAIRWSAVAIMGGHNVGRDAPVYADIAHLGRRLARDGFLVVTGGGPGLMEAANLGAYSAGFTDDQVLDRALRILVQAPLYSDPQWLVRGFEAWKEMGNPGDAMLSRNLGIPTWFYGHEPPNLFATGIAKFFENSIREDCLLALALAGVIYAPGSAGTLQEVFQDACQNYYQTCEGVRSPMILFDSAFWNPPDSSETDEAMPVYPLLRHLARRNGFADLVRLADSVDTVMHLLHTLAPSPPEPLVAAATKGRLQ